METLEVHSKDFLVKWVHVTDNCSISWQLKPLKKSINFGIYRKNDQLGLLEETGVNELTDSSFADSTPTPLSADHQGLASAPASDLASTNPTSRLRSPSVASVNKITELNIFKTKSRSSTFSSSLSNSDLILVKNYYKLMPGELVRGNFEVTKGGTFAFIFDNTFSKTTSKKVLFSSTIIGGNETPQQLRGSSNTRSSNTATDANETQEASDNIMRPKNGELMQSVLMKRRRKKLQGYVKRFFILNFKYGTLSYFKNDSNKLRGQMPINHSIISANSKTREIFIDSGMEVWDLKALNEDDFEAWVNAFNSVKSEHQNEEALDGERDYPRDYVHDYKEDLDAAVTGLFKILQNFEAIPSSQLESEIRFIADQAKSALEARTHSDHNSLTSNNEFYDAHEHIDGFGVVLVDNSPTDRKSDEELEDGEDASDSSSSGSDDDSEDLPAPTASVHGSKSDAADDNHESVDSDLYPLPHDPVERRCDIPVCDHVPPSLLSFVRKNVGKDLSSLSMPVDMNEPITILQRYAEIMEYCDLIDNALQGKYPEESGEFILRIAAFATSYLSSMRKKVRSSRKPFNPLLGETFELVREDKGFRLICEKVSHRPPVFAMFVEAKDWTISFSPAPSQKFWGKTSEIYTKGTLKLTIRSLGEVLTWAQPTCVLKNIIAGEKYTEPASSMTIKSSSGQRAVVEFSKGGMFSGRSEDLTIKAFDSNKKTLPYTVTGKWTETMTLKTTTTEKTIWTAGDLLPNAEKKFGFTEFAGSLNKITEIEKGYLPPTDSRLRPDMKSYEAGNVQAAEKLKQEVEEGQRERRKALEDANQAYIPQYFERTGGPQADVVEWTYVTGNGSYWDRRKRRDWSDVQQLW